MSLLTLDRLAQSFGALDLFRGVSASVAKGGRIGLVGPNGVGKTTLLAIIAGQARPAAGTVRMARDTRLGYLPQEAADAFPDPARGLEAELLTVFDDLRRAEAELAEMAEDLAARPDDAELLARYGQRQAAFEAAGGYDYRVRTRQVLQGLGFADRDARQPVGQLSGGQKTRALLARLLLQRPELLILDEPTNHLDIEAVAWLEGALAMWEGAVLVVSHDRYFLDRVVNQIWELRPDGLEAYSGGYSAYHQERAGRWARRAQAFQDMQERFAKELDYIRRHIAGQNTNIAKGKLARLGREVEAVHAGGLAVLGAIQSKGWAQATAGLDVKGASDKVNEVARRIGELRSPDGELPEFNLRLAPPARGGDIVLRTQGLLVGYPGRPLLRVDDLELWRGERVAILGGNGTGKTTLLRSLLGQLPPLDGQLRLGAGLELGYFSQTHEGLRPERTVLESLMDAYPGLLVAEARGYLGQFLFSGDDQFKTVGSLSGGERGRLALAILARRGANLLLMDEPTNHLDIPAQELLEAVLRAYAGTVLLVSHDRYLVSRVATRVWAVEEEGMAEASGKSVAGAARSADASGLEGNDEGQGGSDVDRPIRRLRAYPFGYADYLEARKAAAEGGAAAPKGRPVAAAGRPLESAGIAAAGMATNGTAFKGTPAAVPAGSRAPISKNEQRRLAQALADLEEAIALKEEERDGLAAALQAASERGEVARIHALGAEHQALEEEIAGLYGRWEAMGG
jgi:ATP-binding cassette subfamily F protein 3